MSFTRSSKILSFIKPVFRWEKESEREFIMSINKLMFVILLECSTQFDGLSAISFFVFRQPVSEKKGNTNWTSSDAVTKVLKSKCEIGICQCSNLMSIKGERERQRQWENVRCFNISKMINALPIQRRQWTLIFGACLRRKTEEFFSFHFVLSLSSSLKHRWNEQEVGVVDEHDLVVLIKIEFQWLPFSLSLCKTFKAHIIICTIFPSKSRETDTSFQFGVEVVLGKCFFSSTRKIPKWKTNETNSTKVK